jgi:predicted DNA-binding transcriptional regulator AlpA
VSEHLTTAEYLTTAEFAELIRRPTETVRYWRHIGTGPKSFKVGRGVLYARADVEAWIEKARNAATAGR